MYFPKKLEPTLLFNKITKCPNTVPDRSRILKSTIVLMKSFILDEYDGEILRSRVKMGQNGSNTSQSSRSSPSFSNRQILQSSTFHHLRPGPASFSAASPSGHRRSPVVHDSTTQTPQRSEGSGANLLGPAPGGKIMGKILRNEQHITAWCPAVL